MQFLINTFLHLKYFINFQVFVVLIQPVSFTSWVQSVRPVIFLNLKIYLLQYIQKQLIILLLIAIIQKKMNYVLYRYIVLLNVYPFISLSIHFSVYPFLRPSIHLSFVHLSLTVLFYSGHTFHILPTTAKRCSLSLLKNMMMTTLSQTPPTYFVFLPYIICNGSHQSMPLVSRNYWMYCRVVLDQNN